MAGKNQIDDAELCYYLDRMIALTQKGLIHWQCSECCGPVTIPEENGRGECKIQDIQLWGEYHGKRFELDVTEMICMPSREVNLLALLRLPGITAVMCTFSEKNQEDANLWDRLLALWDLIGFIK